MTTTWTVLKNGVKFISEHKESSKELVLFAGSRIGEAEEWKNQSGYTHLFEHVALLRGKNKNHSLQRINHRAKHNLTADATTHRDCIYFSFQGLRSQRRHLFKDAMDTVTCNVDINELDIEKRIVISDLKEAKRDVITLADRVMHHAIFGDTPFTKTFRQEIESVEHATSAGVEKLRDRVFKSSNIIIVAISSIPQESLEKTVDETFGTLPRKRTSSASKQYTLTTPLNPSTIIEYTHKGLPGQAYVQHTMLTGSPDLTSMAIMSVLRDVIGWNHHSALFKSMRQAAGQTYMPATDITFTRPVMYLDTNYFCEPRYADSTNKNSNITLFREVLERLATRPLKEQRFRRHQEYAIKEYAAETENDMDRAAWYLETEAANVVVRPQDFTKLISSVTPDMLQKAVQEWYPTMRTLVFQPEGFSLLTPLKKTYDLVAEAQQMELPYDDGQMELYDTFADEHTE